MYRTTLNGLWFFSIICRTKRKTLKVKFCIEMSIFDANDNFIIFIFISITLQPLQMITIHIGIIPAHQMIVPFFSSFVHLLDQLLYTFIIVALFLLLLLFKWKLVNKPTERKEENETKRNELTAWKSITIGNYPLRCCKIWCECRWPLL